MKKTVVVWTMCALAACVLAAPAKKAAFKKGVKKGAVAQKAVKKAPAPAAAIPETPYRKTPYVGALSGDAATGEIFFRANAEAKARPASVTKLMTALLVLEDVAAGKYKLDTEVSAGPMALRQEPSIIGFQDPKTKQPLTRSVDTLLYALMIRSANDAAVALAEHANGNLEAFVARMNARAKALGMNSTKYFNPNGLPPNAVKRYPWKDFNVSTCADQFKLAREVVLHHPEILKYTKCKTWVMPDGLKIINHNNVMRMDKYKIVNPDGTEAVDGLKTGYIDGGGSSVVLTGTRGGKRVITVVLGSQTAKLRDTEGRKLMLQALERVGGAGEGAPSPKVAPSAPVPAAPTPEPSAPPAATGTVPTPAPAAAAAPEPAPEPVPPAEKESEAKPASSSGFLTVLFYFVFAAAAGGIFYWVYRGFGR